MKNRSDTKSMIFLLAIFVSLLMWTGALRATTSEKVDSKTVILGVVPQQSARVLAQNWIPLTRYLSESTGLTIKFATAKDIPTFEARLAQKQYDVAYMNPYHFVYFNERAGYQALAKQKDKRIKGIFVVRKDADINTLEQLRAANLAFPAPAAFAASILTRGTLEQSGIQFTPNYVSSHDSVYIGVAKGIFPAGGGVMRTYQLAPQAIREQLRILHTTNGFTPHALAVSPDLDAVTSRKLLSALVQLGQTGSGQKILKGINIKSFEAAKNEDWDDVKALNLSELMGAH